MTSLSQLNDGIGPSSSFEEKSQRSSCSSSIRSQAYAVDHVAIEQERMDRSNDVRERLGPLIQRLSDSVKNIQTLERSMQTRTGGKGDRPIHNHSQKLVNQNMEMVKRKMFRLKTMEEELSNSEDRHVALHHYFQQQLSLRATEANTETPQRNLEYENRITELEEEIRILKDKSVLVDDLRMRNARLLVRTKDYGRLQHELEVERSLRRKLESSLFEHQHKMNEQAVNYENLNGKFEHLTNTIANLTEVLQTHENEMMDTMALHERYVSNASIPPKTIEHSEANDNSTLTEPMTSLSWTESTISNDDASIVEMIGPINDSKTIDESLVRLDDVETRSTVEHLQAKIDALNRENAALRESTNQTLNKYRLCHEEISRQASMIESLRQKLGCDMLKGGAEPSTRNGD